MQWTSTPDCSLHDSSRSFPQPGWITLSVWASLCCYDLLPTAGVPSSKCGVCECVCAKFMCLRASECWWIERERVRTGSSRLSPTLPINCSINWSNADLSSALPGLQHLYFGLITVTWTGCLCPLATSANNLLLQPLALRGLTPGFGFTPADHAQWCAMAVRIQHIQQQAYWNVTNISWEKCVDTWVRRATATCSSSVWTLTRSTSTHFRIGTNFCWVTRCSTCSLSGVTTLKRSMINDLIGCLSSSSSFFCSQETF